MHRCIRTVEIPDTSIHDAYSAPQLVDSQVLHVVDCNDSTIAEC